LKQTTTLQIEQIIFNKVYPHLNFYKKTLQI